MDNKGREKDSTITFCPACNGEGTRIIDMASGLPPIEMTCGRCDGKGIIGERGNDEKETM